MDSQAITIIRGNSPLPINAGFRYHRSGPDCFAGIVAVFLGITAIVPVLLVMFI